jgi:hypothetical protein
LVSKFSPQNSKIKYDLRYLNLLFYLFIYFFYYYSYTDFGHYTKLTRIVYGGLKQETIEGIYLKSEK